ncbi:hypothetical protein M3Y96_00169600 [Aphelenchoides besseyi]|nr:hypothetical protein M3Y96_00169600 [Aphelenchoides besseyi]
MVNFTRYESSLFTVANLSLGLQLYVVALIRHRSSPSMFHYRYFLTTFKIWNLIFTIIATFLIRPEPYEPLVAEVFNKFVIYSGETGANLMLSLLPYSAINILLNHVYLMIYRLSAIHDNRLARQIFLLSKWKFGIFILFQVITIVGMNSNDRFYTRELLVRELLLKGQPISEIYFLYFGSIFASLILIGFTFAHLRTFSSPNLQLHKQLAILLTLQLTTFFSYFAVAALPVKVQFFFILGCGGVNSAFTVLLIGPYRDHIYRKLIFPIISKVREHSASVGQDVPMVNLTSNR